MSEPQNHPRQCTATRRDGSRCTRWAIAGGTVCPAHGGSTRQAKAAAQRRIRTEAAMADAQAMLAHEGVEQIDSPLEELGRVAAEVIALKDALAQRVNALEGELSTSSSLGVDQLRVEVELYERALDRSGKFLDMLVRSGFEEKRLRLQEAQALAVVGALRRTLSAVGLTAEQQSQASTVLAQELRALDTGRTA